MTIKIILYNETRDTAKFGDELSKVFQDAGLIVVETSHMTLIGPTLPPGISFWFSGEPNISTNPQLKLAAAIAERLATAGVFTEKITINKSGVQELAICVTPLE